MRLLGKLRNFRENCLYVLPVLLLGIYQKQRRWLRNPKGSATYRSLSRFCETATRLIYIYAQIPQGIPAGCVRNISASLLGNPAQYPRGDPRGILSADIAQAIFDRRNILRCSFLGAFF